jgi:hypothetical protein
MGGAPLSGAGTDGQSLTRHRRGVAREVPAEKSRNSAAGVVLWGAAGSCRRLRKANAESSVAAEDPNRHNASQETEKKVPGPEGPGEASRGPGRQATRDCPRAGQPVSGLCSNTRLRSSRRPPAHKSANQPQCIKKTAARCHDAQGFFPRAGLGALAPLLGAWPCPCVPITATA